MQIQIMCFGVGDSGGSLPQIKLYHYNHFHLHIHNVRCRLNSNMNADCGLEERVSEERKVHIKSLKNRHHFYKHCEGSTYVSALNFSKLCNSSVCECQFLTKLFLKSNIKMNGHYCISSDICKIKPCLFLLQVNLHSLQI